MGSAKATVPFSGTPEQEAKLLEVIAEKQNEKGALMPILQKAQEIYGYLPIEVQTIISDKTGVPLEKIYGIVTFMHSFLLILRVNTKFQFALVLLVMLKAQATYIIKFRKNSVFRVANVLRTASSHWKHAAVSVLAVLLPY